MSKGVEEGAAAPQRGNIPQHWLLLEQKSRPMQELKRADVKVVAELDGGKRGSQSLTEDEVLKHDFYGLQVGQRLTA